MIRGSVLIASIATVASLSWALTAQARELRLHFHPIPVNPVQYKYPARGDPLQVAYLVDGALVSDGTRWLAFTSGQGQLRVYDTKTGRLSAPGVDPRCGPTAIHRGLVLIACIAEQGVGPMPVPAPSVLDLARYTLTKVAGDFHVEDQPDAVGRYWIAEESIRAG